ncbi:hypothetical protein D3C76_1884200 [compost metagenome]
MQQHDGRPVPGFADRLGAAGQWHQALGKALLQLGLKGGERVIGGVQHGLNRA